MSKKKDNLAILSPEEDDIWDKNMEFYINEGFSDDEAAEHAWKDLQSEFPRLRKYDGAK